MEAALPDWSGRTAQQGRQRSRTHSLECTDQASECLLRLQRLWGVSRNAPTLVRQSDDSVQVVGHHYELVEHGLWISFCQPTPARRDDLSAVVSFEVKEASFSHRRYVVGARARIVEAIQSKTGTAFTFE